MKKLFFLFVSFLATTCLWAYDFQSGDLYYNITSSSAPFTVEVTYEYRSSYNYSGLTTATIPENVTYNGATYSVTSIGDYAFYYCSSLTSVTIPNSVTYIAENAFENCSSLTSVTIPDKVTTIGSEAFYKCSSLTSVTIPNSVTRIREGAFGRCSSLTSIIIPNSVTEVGGGLFYGCSLLESIVLSENISSISHMYNVGGFFENCSSLTSITIPNSVTSIGDAAFAGCSSLTSITIPNSVTSIGDAAFEDCSSLTSVTIPKSVTTIGKNAFAGCSSLTSVTLPNRVTSIPPRAFWGCSSLTSVTIPDKITSIGQGAFEDCSSLTSVTIPNSVTYIADYAFENCSSLTSVTIPNKVTTIRASAFLGCSSLTSVTIPNSVTSIGDAAFAGCSSLTSVTINSDAIVKKNYSYESNLSHIFGSQVTEYIIGERVTSIGEFAFAGCSSLTSVTIPNSVTSIGKDAFSSCSSLTLVTINSDAIVSHCYMDVIFGSQVTKYIIGESVTSIRDFAFYNCFSLTSVIISNGVTSIGGAAFLDCSSLTSVTIPNSVTSIGEEAFAGTRIYNDNSNWEDGVLYIDDCLIKAKESISEKYTIKENTRLIAYGAFEDCSSLTSVTISNGVTSIGGAAFMDCSSLTSVTIGESVTSIGDGAFCRCSSLTSLTIGNGVTSIGEGAFAGCSLTIVVCKATDVPNIEVYAFDDFSESHATLYVPKASLDEYNSTEPWSNFKHILPIEDSGEEPSNPDDEEDDGAITCAEAVSICQQTGTTATTKEYTIRGYVTKIEMVYSEQYDNITFWMADTSPMQMDNSSNSVTSLSDYPNIALGKSTTASSSEDSGTLPEYINDGNFNTRWSSEWQDNEYISIDLEQYSFIDHITLHWETAYASQFAILITDEQPSSSTLSLPLPSSATYYQSSGDVQTIPVAKSGRYITLIGIERATAYGISLYELEAYGMPLLQAYCVKPIQNTDKYVQIGDYVEAVGTLVNYGGTTPEINAGGTYTILTKHEENGSTTSVENTNTPSPMTNCQKIIRNGQLLILRDGKTYNVMGQEL